MLLLGTPGCPEVEKFVFLPKKWHVVFFVSSTAIIMFVATKQLRRPAIRTKTPCGVRYVACHVQVALLLSSLGLHDFNGVQIGALLLLLQQWPLVASVRRTFLVG